MTNSSIWLSLRNPVFRQLWVASLISGCCVSAHDTAATWVMNTLSPSSFLISLLSTVAALPFFLFTLPAGALADMTDRRRLLAIMTLWLAVSAGALAVLAWVHLLNPFIVLACVFLVGVGFSFYAPVWSSLVPEVVSKEELASAVTLGGLQMNVSGIIGPALGGVLLAIAGAPVVFGINAVCFLLVLLPLLRWRRRRRHSRVPLENFLESFASAVRYVRYAPGMQVILARDVLFSVFIAVIPALLPVVGLRQLHLSPTQLGCLFTSMGIGSVVGAVLVIPWARKTFSANVLTIVSSCLLVVVYLLMAVVRHPILFQIVAGLAGIGWTLTASELWVAGQRAMPSWARGRMNATHMMVSQGGMALGGVIWGALASGAGVHFALVSAALLLLFSLSLAFPLSIDFTHQLNLDPAPLTTQYHRFLHTPEPRDGPVSIVMIFDVDPERRAEFLDRMREMRLIYLRNGAFSWRLDEDLEQSDTFRMEMLVASWSEHLQQHERMTKAELAAWREVWQMHIGKGDPVVKHYLSVQRELLARRPSTSESANHDREPQGETAASQETGSPVEGEA